MAAHVCEVDLNVHNLPAGAPAIKRGLDNSKMLKAMGDPLPDYRTPTRPRAWGWGLTVARP